MTLTLPVVATVPPTMTDSIFCTPLSPAWSGIWIRRRVMYPLSDPVAPVALPVVPSLLV